MQAVKPCVEIRRRLCFKVRHVLLERVVLRVALQFQRIHIRNKCVVLRRRKGLIFSEPRLKLCVKSRRVDLLNDCGNNAAKRRVQALIRDLALRDCCYARAHVDVRQRKLVNVRVPLQCGRGRGSAERRRFDLHRHNAVCQIPAHDNAINTVQLSVRRVKLDGKIARVEVEVTVDPRFARFNVQLHSVVCNDLKPRRRDGENAVPDERIKVFRPILRLVRAIVRNAVEET